MEGFVPEHSGLRRREQNSANLHSGSAERAGVQCEASLVARMLVSLGREFPARTSFAQALIFALIVQAHAERRDLRVSDLAGLAGDSRHAQPVLGDGVRHTYQMFLETSREVPDGLGWVRLEVDPRDRRAKLLRLTESGMAVAARVLGGVGSGANVPTAPPVEPRRVQSALPQAEVMPRPKIEQMSMRALNGLGDPALFNGDCLDVLATLPDRSVDVVIADPPYGVTRFDWDDPLALEPLWTELRRVLKPTGSVIVTATQPYASKLVMSNPEWFKYNWVWEKTKPLGFHHAWQMPLRNHEEILVFSPGVLVGKYRSQRQATYNPQDLVELERPVVRKNPARKGKMFHRTPGKTSVQTHTNFPKSVLRFASERNIHHPTQKPLDLMRYLVRTYSNPGEVVLDFCMGSGTTGVAARVERRRFIGIERDAGYFEVARRRIDGAVIATAEQKPEPIVTTPVLDVEPISPTPKPDVGPITVEPILDIEPVPDDSVLGSATNENAPAEVVRRDPWMEWETARKRRSGRKQRAPDPVEQIAGNRLIRPSQPDFELRLGDCLDEMRKMADGSVDLIVTSPPYNLGTSASGGLKERKAGRWPNAKLAQGYATYDDAMPREEYVEWQKTLLREMWRLIPNDGAIFYNHKPRIQNGVVQLPTDYNPGLPIRQIVIWARGSGMNYNVRQFTPSHEWIMIMAKPDFRLTRAAAEMDVWRISPETKNDHPAPFPVEVARRCIRHTNAKVILDPFSGSGTTGVAALELGRRYIGIDLAPQYIEASRKRLEAVVPLPLVALGDDALQAA